MTRLTRAEQETILTRANDQKLWHIWSADPVELRRLEKAFGPGRRDGEHGFVWEVPRNSVRFKAPPTSEQRAMMRERAKASGFGKKARKSS